MCSGLGRNDKREALWRNPLQAVSDGVNSEGALQETQR